MTAKADLIRALQDVSRSEEAIRADCLSIARRRKLSTKAIARVGTEVGVALTTSRKPVNVEEADTCLVRERLKATKSMEGTAIDPTQDVSTVQQEENDKDTVSPSTTPVHTPDVVAMIHTLTTHISELQTELADLKAMFVRERSEARDREQRQKNKITELEKILNTHVESFDKTSDMARTMLKSIDAKSTSVISDLKKAGSAVRSESRSTPGTHASISTHTPDTHVRSGTRITTTSDSDTTSHTDGVSTHSAGRATTDSVSTASQRKKSATAPSSTKSALPKPHAVKPIAPDDDDDELWSLVLKAKPTGRKSVLYIGNLEENASEEKLREYIAKRSEKAGINRPKIFNCTIFTREEGNWAVGLLASPSTTLPLSMFVVATSGPDAYMLDHGNSRSSLARNNKEGIANRGLPTPPSPVASQT